MGDTGRESSRKEDSRPKMKFLQELHFKLKLRRKPTRAALISITFPVVLLLALNMLGYILPIDSGEKTETSMAVFLTFAVFLLIIKDSLPTTDIPHTLTTDTPHTLTTDNSPYFNNGQLPIIYHLCKYSWFWADYRCLPSSSVAAALQRWWQKKDTGREQNRSLLFRTLQTIRATF